MPKSNHEEIEKLKEFFEKLPSRTDKPLSKITIMNYVSKLNKLSQLVEGHPWNGDDKFLMNAKKVISAIDKAQITGKKDFLSPVLRLLKSMNVDSNLITEYQKGLAQFKNDEYSDRKKNKASDDKAEDSLPLSQILEKIKAYKPQTDMQLVYLLINALYFMNTLVPRNDLNIVKLASSSKKAKDLNKEFNYILIDKDGTPSNLVWNNYKSNHTFGSKKFPITREVQTLIKEYVKRFGKANGDYLFNMRNGEPYKKSNFLDLIKTATEAVLGKQMGVDLIRQIQITDYYRDKVKTIEEDEKDAERYLHSSNIHKEYYRGNLAEGSDTEKD
jgi:hypothetical protein